VAAPAKERLDVRGLPPCEPMERILARLDAMPDGCRLEAVLDRDPALLYPILDARGWRWRRIALTADRCELLIWAAGVERGR